MRLLSKIGNRRHPHSTALGKVLLAALRYGDPSITKALGMLAFTSRTLITPDQLVVEIERVRVQGW